MRAHLKKRLAVVCVHVDLKSNVLSAASVDVLFRIQSVMSHVFVQCHESARAGEAWRFAALAVVGRQCLRS